MERLIECIPNISDGRNPSVLQAVLEALRMPGIRILGTYVGASTNRSVITYVSEPEAVVDAALAVLTVTSNLIDMRSHSGSHPRLGGTDVFPLVPLRGVTMEDCVTFSEIIASRASTELGIPVYLYANSAKRRERTLLSSCRKGQYESINSRIGDPFWKPDYGELAANSTTGATVVGARDFLIAYNINLGTQDKQIADNIAAAIRESGSHGARPGIFKDVSAIGWYLEEHKIAQVSTNIRNYHAAPPHLIFEACSRLALSFATTVTGSELIGLIPEEALVLAGKASQRTSNAADLAQAGAEYLGLGSLSTFNCDERVIERVLKKSRPLSL